MMGGFRDLLVGLVTGLASILVVLGSFSLALFEASPNASLTSKDSSILLTLVPTKTLGEAAVLKITSTAALSENAEIPFSIPAACSFPEEWQPYLVEAGETLAGIAASYGITTEELRDANCLDADTLIAETEIYVPFLTPADEPESSPEEWCGRPQGWIAYIVRQDDTLFELSLRYDVSVPMLQKANCLSSADYIRRGDILYVPDVPPRYYLPPPPPHPQSTPTAPPTLTVEAPPVTPPTAETNPPGETAAESASPEVDFIATQTTPAPEVSPSVESSLPPE